MRSEDTEKESQAKDTADTTSAYRDKWCEYDERTEDD
jgi:hypothetical protein